MISLVQHRASTHLGGVEKDWFLYDFTGNVTSHKITHKPSSGSSLSEVIMQTYDTWGRPVKTNQKRGSSTAKTIANRTYDAAGRMTKDTAKGISSITWNVLGLPQTVTFSSGVVINYSYAADGTKLRESKTASGTTTTTDYTGNLVLEDGTRSRMLFDGGYVSLSDNAYHFFITDHLGSVRVVASASGVAEEYDHYYPLGGLLPTSTSATGIQPVKYQGKEWAGAKGLNLYDFGARRYDPATGRWLSQDPLAEKYYGHSPYLFCAANPMRYVDPTGMRIYIKGYEYLDNQIIDYSGKAISLEDMDDFSRDVYNSLLYISQSESGKQLIQSLQYSDFSFNISKSSINRFTNSDYKGAHASELNLPYDDFIYGAGGTIYWNSKGSPVMTTAGKQNSPELNLVHEMAHAYDSSFGLLNDEMVKQVKKSEWQAIYNENIIRQELGLPLRTRYLKATDTEGNDLGYTGPCFVKHNKPYRPSWY